MILAKKYPIISPDMSAENTTSARGGVGFQNSFSLVSRQKARYVTFEMQIFLLSSSFCLITTSKSARDDRYSGRNC